METFRSQPGDLFVNTYNIEKAISDCHKYSEHEGLSPDVQDAFSAIMAEVYEMRRTLKPMLSEDNKKRVNELTRSRQ